MPPRFLRDVGLFSLCNALQSVVFFVYAIAAARLLGEDGYSLFQALMGVHGLLMVVALPLNMAALHLVAAAPTQTRRRALGACLSVALLVGIAEAVGLTAAAPLLRDGLKAGTTSPFYVLAALAFVNTSVVVFHGGLQGANRYGTFALVRIAEALVTAGAGVTLMLSGYGVAGAIAGYAIGMGGSLVFLAARRQSYTLVRNVAAVVSDNRAVLRPLLVVVSLLLVANWPAVLARRQLAAAEAADYAALFALRFVVLTFVTAVAWPLYSHTVAGDEVTRRRSAMLGVLLPSGVLLAIALLVPELFLQILFGANFVSAAGIFGLYAGYLMAHALAAVVLFHAAALRSVPAWLFVLPAAPMLAITALPVSSPAALIATQVAAVLVPALLVLATERARAGAQ